MAPTEPRNAKGLLRGPKVRLLSEGDMEARASISPIEINGIQQVLPVGRIVLDLHLLGSAGLHVGIEWNTSFGPSGVLSDGALLTPPPVYNPSSRERQSAQPPSPCKRTRRPRASPLVAGDTQ